VSSESELLVFIFIIWFTDYEKERKVNQIMKIKNKKEESRNYKMKMQKTEKSRAKCDGRSGERVKLNKK
jgi:hypothetical protein